MQYYLNSEETKLVTETFETEKTQAADQVAAMEENISSQKSTKERVALLPEDVSILECRLENHQLTKPERFWLGPDWSKALCSWKMWMRY